MSNYQHFIYTYTSKISQYFYLPSYWSLKIETGFAQTKNRGLAFVGGEMLMNFPLNRLLMIPGSTEFTTVSRIIETCNNSEKNIQRCKWFLHCLNVKINMHEKPTAVSNLLMDLLLQVVTFEVRKKSSISLDPLTAALFFFFKQCLYQPIKLYRKCSALPKNASSKNTQKLKRILQR